MKIAANFTPTNASTSLLRWPAVGLLVGIASLLSAQLLDAALTGKMPDIVAFLGRYALAGTTFALAYSPAVLALLPTRGERLRIDWSTVHSSTVGFVLFLVLTLVIAPDSSGRWLAYFYPASILLGWLASQLPFVSRKLASANIQRSIDWDRLPYGIFLVAALVLLIASAVCSVNNQRSAAIQLANWAYGFLWLAVLTAGFCVLMDQDIATDKLRGITRFLLPVAALAFFPLSLFIDANSSTPPEKQVIIDTYPNFLAQQVRTGDILVSDSPALRLSSIPQIGPSISVDPDQRGQALWDDLTRALDTSRRVLWISVPDQSHDSRGTLATFLKSNACLDYISGSSLPVRVYELNKPFTRPSVLSSYWATRTADAFDPITVNFGPIVMTGIRYEQRACSHDSVAIAVRWQLPAKTPSPLKLSLFLQDAMGRRIQTQDLYIDDPGQRHTDQWPPGASVPAYYLLTIPVGTPPGSFKLGAGVYQVSQPQWLPIRSAEGVKGQMDHVTVGSVQVYRAEDVSADPWNSRQESGLLPANAVMADGLSLDGYAIANPTIIPGESLSLALRWRAAKDGLASYTTNASLRQAGKVIAQASGIPVDGTYPTDQWRSGEYVAERKEVLVPADAAGGTAQVEVSVAGGEMTYLADIAIQTITRTYQMPAMAQRTSAGFRGVGRLVGYDLANASPDSNQPLGLTLHWQAGALTDKDYTVFAQLLSEDGHLIAQSDSQPAQGHRPTRSWLPGEIIADQHSLEFKDASYRGEAKLIVGLYDPDTGERVPVEGGIENYFVVPTRVQVGAK